MELKIRETIRLSGDIITDDELVVGITAEIGGEGNGTTNLTKTIYNQQLYDKNKKEVRQKIAEFDGLYYQAEDKWLKEAAKD